MKEEIKIMKIGAGRSTVDGVIVKQQGYAPRAGKSLSELLKEFKKVEMTAMGESAVNNMVKAICHATRILQEDGLSLKASDFCFKTEKLQRHDAVEVEGVLVSVIITLD